MRQKGNALFLILIAVALFAALAFAVTKSRSNSSSINKEKRILDFVRVQQYFSMLRAGCQRMILTGTPVSALQLADGGHSGSTPCSSGDDCLFASEGGGITAQTPPSGLGSGLSYVFFEYQFSVAVDGIGTSDPELVAAVTPLTDEVCSEINVKLKLGSTIPSVAPGLLLDGFPGELQGCFETGGSNYYYFALVEN